MLQSLFFLISDRYSDEFLSRLHIVEKYDFKRIVEKYDTFVAYCSDGGKSLQIMKYLGTINVEGTDNVAT